MNEDETLWTRHHLEKVPLSVEIYVRWAQLFYPAEDGGNLVQPIAETDGLLFLRFGPDETVEHFLSSLSDTFTTATVIDDQPVAYLGRQARRLTMLTERKELSYSYTDQSGQLRYGRSEARRTHISVTSFEVNRVPVLVGYRLPEEELETYRPILERFVSSVALEE